MDYLVLHTYDFTRKVQIGFLHVLLHIIAYNLELDKIVKEFLRQAKIWTFIIKLYNLNKIISEEPTIELLSAKYILSIF